MKTTAAGRFRRDLEISSHCLVGSYCVPSFMRNLIVFFQWNRLGWWCDIPAPQTIRKRDFSRNTIIHAIFDDIVKNWILAGYPCTAFGGSTSFTISFRYLSRTQIVGRGTPIPLPWQTPHLWTIFCLWMPMNANCIDAGRNAHNSKHLQRSVESPHLLVEDGQFFFCFFGIVCFYKINTEISVHRW